MLRRQGVRAVEGVYAWTSGSTGGTGTFNGILDGTRVSADIDADYELIAPMANVFYDVPLTDQLTGYMGAGPACASTSDR